MMMGFEPAQRFELYSPAYYYRSYTGGTTAPKGCWQINAGGYNTKEDRPLPIIIVYRYDHRSYVLHGFIAT